MVSETRIYYLNIYFSCKHSNIIATFLSQGELNKNLICHINSEQKCRYPKPVGSINPYLPYYFTKMALKALGIFRVQQNGPSNAFFFFFQGTFVTAKQTALLCRVHMLDVLRPSQQTLCVPDRLCCLFVQCTHWQKWNLGLFPPKNPRFLVPAWSQIFQICAAVKKLFLVSLFSWCAETLRAELQANTWLWRQN